MELSIIVPSYNEELAVNIFYNEVLSVCSNNNIDFEIIFVDDGSTDSTIEKIEELSNKSSNIHYIEFSKHFGKDAAIMAGLKKAQGLYCVIMDIDLQDPPELLPKMLNMIKNKDIDCVETCRETRFGEPLVRSVCAELFCKFMNLISNVKIKKGIRDFRLMKRNIVEKIISFEETNLFLKGIFSFVGFKTECIYYKNVERKTSKSKWSLWGLVKYALNGIISFTSFPLYLPFIFSLILFCVGLFGIIYYYLNLGLNFKILYVSLLFLLFAFNSLFIGFIGVYIDKIYVQTLKRPLYIIRKEK